MISSITWMAVLVGASDEQQEIKLRAFLNRFAVLPVDIGVSERAVMLRRQFRMRMPDAGIWAAALCASSLLVSRNTRDFPAEHPGVRVPYRL